MIHCGTSCSSSSRCWCPSCASMCASTCLTYWAWCMTTGSRPHHSCLISFACFLSYQVSDISFYLPMCCHVPGGVKSHKGHICSDRVFATVQACAVSHTIPHCALPIVVVVVQCCAVLQRSYIRTLTAYLRPLQYRHKEYMSASQQLCCAVSLRDDFRAYLPELLPRFIGLFGEAERSGNYDQVTLMLTQTPLLLFYCDKSPQSAAHLEYDATFCYSCFHITPLGKIATHLLGTVGDLCSPPCRCQEHCML